MDDFPFKYVAKIYYFFFSSFFSSFLTSAGLAASAGFVVSAGFAVVSAGGGVAGGAAGGGVAVSVLGASPFPLPQEATKSPIASARTLSLTNFIIYVF
jgi:hypothetical protein